MNGAGSEADLRTELAPSSIEPLPKSSQDIVCPVCGAAAVPEKCKVLCRSDKCRGRIIFNCSEF
jgi:hypothetical protein